MKQFCIKSSFKSNVIVIEYKFNNFYYIEKDKNESCMFYSLLVK